MIDTPKIVQLTAQATAVVRLNIARDQIQHVMGPAMGEVMATLTEQGAAPAGAMFSHHFAMHSDVFDFEVGVPVAAPVKAQGRVVLAELPAGRVACTAYRGSYEGLGAAWGELMNWIDNEGLATQAGLWECYVSGPESSPDPAQWRTDLYKPLAG
jgi:effector-binding domain-containing protein